MANRDMGRVTPIYQGNYSATTRYELNDIVMYTDGCIYWHVGTTATTGTAPTDTTVWKLAARAGKSAYEYAVDAGYEGTEADFMEMLVDAAAMDDRMDQAESDIDSQASRIGELEELSKSVTSKGRTGYNILPQESTSGYWDTITGEAVENIYMTRSVGSIQCEGSNIYITTANGFNSSKVCIIYLNENDEVISSKTFSSDGSQAIPSSTKKIKVYINGLTLDIQDVCLSYSEIEYEEYQYEYKLKYSSFPDEYNEKIEQVEYELDETQQKTGRIEIETSSFEDAEIITQETAEYTNGAWTANGTIATTTASLKYNAIDIIDVVPGGTYLLNRFYGYYFLYDDDMNNGTQSDIWTSYQNVTFVIPTGKTKIGINVSATHFPSSFALKRLTPIQSEYEDLKTAIKFLNGQKIVNFGDSIFGMFRENVGNDMSVSSMLRELTGAENINVGFGGCRMAEHPTSYFDAFSMYKLANSISTNNWTVQEQAIIDGGTDIPDYFSETLTTLEAIDWNDVNAITIAYGTNDFSGNVEENTFKSALSDSIEEILTVYPHIKFVVISPMYLWYSDGGVYVDDSDTHTNGNGDYLKDFCDWCREVSEEYHVKYCDTYSDISINRINRLRYFYETDGTHPNKNGRWARARKIAYAMIESI